MSESLAETTALYAFGLAAICGARATCGHAPDPPVVAAFAVLAGALCLQAVLGAIELIRGHHPPDEPTAIGYLAASAVIVPAIVPGAVAERSRWGVVILALAAVAVAVVSLRLVSVWGR